MRGIFGLGAAAEREVGGPEHMFHKRKVDIWTNTSCLLGSADLLVPETFHRGPVLFHVRVHSTTSASGH